MIKKIVLFDLDGTIALVDHRRHFVERPKGKRDWDSFYNACIDDTPNPALVPLLKCLEKEFRIIIFSGRIDRVRPQTEFWLEKHKIPYEMMIMRSHDDQTPDHELKISWLNNPLIIDRDDVVCVFDDRDSVVEAWRANGIACFQVAPGTF